VKHKFVRAADHIGTHGRPQAVLECMGCGERIVPVPPGGYTKAEYLDMLGIQSDCELQKIAQVIES
jgi:ribosomal protein S27E